MQKTSINLPEIRLVGIKMCTSYAIESNPETGKISSTVKRFVGEELFTKIPNRIKPNVVYCVYTEYESDYKGEYTYFVGEEVSSFEDVPHELETLAIPPQSYTKFTTDPGPMPQVLINAWYEIWDMSRDDLGGERGYHTDFEVYDERANDPNKAVLDIFIGLRK